MSEIIAAEWMTAEECVGAVAVRRVDGWKAYIGTGAGFNSTMDAERIARHGAALRESVARAFFPGITEPYAP